MKTNYKRGLLLCIAIYCFQCTGKVQGMRLGDKLPDVTIEKKDLINYSNENLRLSDFENKVIILDFWNHACTSCISSFPMLDSLQKRFSDRLQIILVNKEGRDSTERFFKKRPKILRPDVPLITGDTLLAKYLRHDHFPFHVWLDTVRTIKYMTSGHNATGENIEKFLKGTPLMVQTMEPIKKRILSHLRDDSVVQKNLMFSSSLSHCSKVLDVSNVGYSGQQRIRPVRLSANCQTVMSLFIKAYEEYSKYRFNLPATVVLEVKDPFPYRAPEDKNLWDSWGAQYRYNYELIVPASSADLAYKIMQMDLTKYFGLDAKVEKRKVRTIVLKRTSSIDKLKTSGGIAEYHFKRSLPKYPVNEPIRYLRNIPFSRMSSQLRSWIESSLKMSFLDETGYNGNIDLEIRGTSVDDFSLQELRKDLAKYDLDLIVCAREIDVLVIKERN